MTTEAALDTRSPRLDRFAFFTVGVLALTIDWNGIRVSHGSFANGFFILATLAVLAHVAVNRRAIPIPPWLLLFAGSMVVAALIESVFPPSPAIQTRTVLQFNQMAALANHPIAILIPSRSNVAALIKWEIALVLIPILVAVVATTPWRINRLLDLWTISAVISALAGLAQFAGLHVPLVSNQVSVSSVLGVPLPTAGVKFRPAGLTIQSNYLALTCALSIPIALRWVGRSKRATLAGAVATLILLGGEYAARSRDGSVSVALALLLALIFLPRLRPYRSWLLPAVVMSMAAVLLFTPFGHSILKQLRLTGNTQSTNGSNYQRTVAKHVATAQIASRPVAGVGFSVNNDAQNIYLQILAAGGVITMCGFLLYIGGLATCVRRAWHGPLREAAIALGIAVIVYLINGYYDAQIADKYLYLLPGILFACARTTSALRASAPAGASAPSTVPAPARALAPIGARGSPA